MLLEKYLHTIEDINPNKIYVENVRHFLKVPTVMAKLLCEMAVVDRVFIKKTGLVCPNSDCNRIIASYSNSEKLPQEICCDICESNEKENFIFKTSGLKKIEFYQLNKRK